MSPPTTDEAQSDENSHYGDCLVKDSLFRRLALRLGHSLATDDVFGTTGTSACRVLKKAWTMLHIFVIKWELLKLKRSVLFTGFRYTTLREESFSSNRLS